MPEREPLLDDNDHQNVYNEFEVDLPSMPTEILQDQPISEETFENNLVIPSEEYSLNYQVIQPR